MNLPATVKTNRQKAKFPSSTSLHGMLPEGATQILGDQENSSQKFSEACLLVDSRCRSNWHPRLTMINHVMAESMVCKRKTLICCCGIYFCFFNFFLDFYNLFYLYQCFVCMYVHVPHTCLVLTQVRRRHWLPWNWSNRWLWTTMWALET